MSAIARRKGRGKASSTLALIDAAVRILEEIHPATVRAVCYRLFVEALIPSMAKANTDKVSKQLVWAREQGYLPWDWVVDETREAEHVNTWRSPREIIEAAVGGYRKDYWQAQPRWVEVWSEKGTIRGTLAPVLKKYGVTFRVMHGYGSATSLHGIAEETARNEKPLTVLYVGDWDPSGLHMSGVDLPTRIARYDGQVEIVRTALDLSDVGSDTALPSFAAESKSRDPRHKWFIERYGQHCWEVDALSPAILRERIEAEIVGRLDMDAWHHAIGIERAERESMANVLGIWNSICGQADKCSPGRQA